MEKLTQQEFAGETENQQQEQLAKFAQEMFKLVDAEGDAFCSSEEVALKARKARFESPTAYGYNPDTDENMSLKLSGNPYSQVLEITGIFQDSAHRASMYNTEKHMPMYRISPDGKVSVGHIKYPEQPFDDVFGLPIQGSVGNRPSTPGWDEIDINDPNNAPIVTEVKTMLGTIVTDKRVKVLHQLSGELSKEVVDTAEQLHLESLGEGEIDLTRDNAERRARQREAVEFLEGLQSLQLT